MIVSPRIQHNGLLLLLLEESVWSVLDMQPQRTANGPQKPLREDNVLNRIDAIRQKSCAAENRHTALLYFRPWPNSPVIPSLDIMS